MSNSLDSFLTRIGDVTIERLVPKSSSSSSDEPGTGCGDEGVSKCASNPNIQIGNDEDSETGGETSDGEEEKKIINMKSHEIQSEGSGDDMDLDDTIDTEIGVRIDSERQTTPSPCQDDDDGVNILDTLPLEGAPIEGQEVSEADLLGKPLLKDDDTCSMENEGGNVDLSPSPSDPDNQKRHADTDEESDHPKKQKKDDNYDDNESKSEKKLANMRRNIREVMDETQLDEATLSAQRQEMERLRRVQEQQRMIREARQLAINRQNNKTQTRVMSLLQGKQNDIGTTLSQTSSSSLLSSSSSAAALSASSGLKIPTTSVLSSKLNSQNQCLPIANSSGGIQIPGKKPMDSSSLLSSSASSRWIKGRNNYLQQQTGTSISRLPGRPPLNQNLLQQRIRMMTPSVSISPVVPKKENEYYSDSDLSEPEIEENLQEQDDKIPAKGKDVVTISSSSEDSDDDCIVLSDASGGEETDTEDDPANSGMHTNDRYNIPDEHGRVLINVGHPETEPDVYLAPQVAKIIKPHQIGGVRFLFDNIIESIERYKSSSGFGCILAHSMGLGKTLQVASFCDIFFRCTTAKTVLCIMPINTLQNWLAEFNMWLPYEDPDLIIKTDKQNSSSTFNQKNDNIMDNIGKSEFKEENSNLTDVSSSMSSTGNHFNQQTYENPYNYQDNLMKTNTNYNQNYPQNSMYGNYPQMKQEMDCQNPQMPSNYPIYPQMGNQNILPGGYPNYHQNPPHNPYQNYQQQQQQQMPQVKTEFEENPVVKNEEEAPPTTTTTTTTKEEETTDDKKESTEKVKTPFNVDAPIGVELRHRHFKLHILNDSHKTMAARARVIKEWQKVGGVLLIGYELYRQLSLKKSNKGKRKRGQAFKDVAVDVEEDDKNKGFLDDMHGALVDPGPDLVICDEGHRIKNSHASISLALKQMRTKRRIVLTGYPLQNNLLEYWCMVDFVRPNYLGTKSEFCNMFERPIQNGQCIDSTPQDIRLMRYRAHVLHALLEGFVQRRSHSVLQISLPRKEEYILLVRMTPHQRKLYDTFMNQVVKTRAVPNPLKAFAVCCKIWNHPDILYHFLRKRQMNEEDDLDLEETIAEKTAAGGGGANKRGTKGKTKKGKKEKIIKNKPAASVQPNSSTSSSSITTNNIDDVNDNNLIDKKPGNNFGNYTQVQNTNYPSGNTNYQQQQQPQQQQQNYGNFQGNDSQSGNYYRSDTNTSEYSEFYGNNQPSGTRYQNQTGTYSNFPQGSSNYQANSNQNYQQSNQNQMYQSGNDNTNNNSVNNYDMFSRQQQQQNYNFPDQSRNYPTNVNQQQYQTNVNQPGNYQNQSNLPINNFPGYNEHQNNSQIYPSQSQQNSQGNIQQTSRYLAGQSPSNQQQNPVGNLANSYGQNQGYQNSITPGTVGSAAPGNVSNTGQIYPNNQGNQGAMGSNGSQPFLGPYPASQTGQNLPVQNSNLTTQPSQNYQQQNSSNFPGGNQGMANFPSDGNNSFKGQDDRFPTWQGNNFPQPVGQQSQLGQQNRSNNQQFYQQQNNYFPGQNYQQNKYQSEFPNDINIKTEDGKPFVDNKKDTTTTTTATTTTTTTTTPPSTPSTTTNVQQNFNNPTDVVTNVSNIPATAPVVVPNVATFPIITNDNKEKDDNTQEKEKDDKSDDEIIPKDEEKDFKNSPSAREDPGIPYDWATDLMKGYVADIIDASAKMTIFFCILEEAIRLGDRILTFSQSLFTLNLIEDFLAKNDYKTSDGKKESWAKNVNYYRLDGSTSALEREKLINEFNHNSKIHLFLVSTRAGSLGINLVGANRAIVFDASWNPCHDTQAVCRVYRYGQKKRCYVYRLVTDNCLERKIYDRQISKQGMADRVVDQCNPDAHLSLKEATTLSWDWEEDSQVQDFSSSKDTYTDEIMHCLLDKHSSLLTKQPFHHESLLVDRKDKKLSQAEKRLARRGYELEKMAANNSRPSYNYIPGNTATRAGGLQIRAIRGNDQGVAPKPVASVRPMQQRGAEGLSNKAGSRWIPAEVWQRQGMSAQEMTLPLDVVIPTNSPDKSSIVLKAGQRVMVLKSPKGIYMQLESGKIIAIRTTLKLNQQKRDEETKKITTTTSSSTTTTTTTTLMTTGTTTTTSTTLSASTSPRGQNLKPDGSFPLRNNSSISIIPKTPGLNQSHVPLSRPGSGSGYRQFSDKDLQPKRQKSYSQQNQSTTLLKQNYNQLNLTNHISLQKMGKNKNDSLDHSSAGENSNSSDSQPRTDQRVEEVRIEDIVAEASTNNEYNNSTNINTPRIPPLTDQQHQLQQQDIKMGRIIDDKRHDYNSQIINSGKIIHQNLKNDLLDHSNKNIKNLQNMINSSDIKSDIRQVSQSGTFGHGVSFGHSSVPSKNLSDDLTIDKSQNQNSMRLSNQLPPQQQQQLLSQHQNIPTDPGLSGGLMSQGCPPIVQEMPKTHNETKNSQTLLPTINQPVTNLNSPAMIKDQQQQMTEQAVDPQGYPYAQYPRYYDYSDQRSRPSNTSSYGSYFPSGQVPTGTRHQQIGKDIQRVGNEIAKTADDRTVPSAPLYHGVQAAPSTGVLPGTGQTAVAPSPPSPLLPPPPPPPPPQVATRETKETKSNEGLLASSSSLVGNTSEGQASAGFSNPSRPGYHTGYPSSFDPYAQSYTTPSSGPSTAVAAPTAYSPSGTPGYTGYGGPGYDANYARMYSAFHGAPTVADPYLHRGYAPPASTHPTNYYSSFPHPPPPPPYPSYPFLPPFSNPNIPSESQPPAQ